MFAAFALTACGLTTTPTAVMSETSYPTQPEKPAPTHTLAPQASPTPTPLPNGLVPGSTVVIGIPQEPGSLNPLVSTAAVDTVIRSFIIEGLVGTDASGQYIPVLAAALPTVSTDGLVLTYRLKPGILFSNGDEFICADVQFTWQAILSDLSAANPSGYSDIRAVECLDDATAVITLNKVYAPYLRLFSFIIPRAAGELSGMANWEYNRSPIGTGPWVVQSWTAGDQITLVKNPTYREAGKPYLDRILLKVLPDHANGLQQLNSGEITVLWPLTEADVLTLQPGVTYTGAPYGAGENEMIVFNLADPTVDAPADPAVHPHPILSDLRVRQAIQFAIDKQEITEKILNGTVSVGTTVLPAGPFACPFEPSQYSLTQAKALLEEAGWVTGADGVRARAGMRLSLRIASTSGDPIRAQVEQALVEMLQKAGIELVLENVPAEEFFAGWASNGIRKHGQFDLLLYTTGPSTDPDSHIFNNYHSSRLPTAENEGVGSNYSRYVNRNVDAWIEEAALTADTKRRKELYCQVARQINNDLPRVLLYERQNISGYREALQNFAVSPGTADFTFNSQNWWLKP